MVREYRIVAHGCGICSSGCIRGIEGLNRGIVGNVVVQLVVIVVQLMMSSGHVVPARLVQIGDKVQPERQAMGAIMILQFWLGVCGRRKTDVGRLVKLM